MTACLTLGSWRKSNEQKGLFCKSSPRGNKACRNGGGGEQRCDTDASRNNPPSSSFVNPPRIILAINCCPNTLLASSNNKVFANLILKPLENHPHQESLLYSLRVSMLMEIGMRASTFPVAAQIENPWQRVRLGRFAEGLKRR